MMSYREWLYNKLVEDGIVDPDCPIIDEEDFTIDDLLTSSDDVNCMDIDDYLGQYHAYCRAAGVEPVINVE